MLFKQFLKQKSEKSLQGFTLIEVLVAILLITLFVNITLQSIVIAVVFKVSAKKSNTATVWIQQDLEKVKATASQLKYDPTNCKTNSQTAGFAQVLAQNLPVLDSSNNLQTIAGKIYILNRSSQIGGTTPDTGSGTCKSNACYEALQLTYSVTPQSGGSSSSVAQIYTEVIPAAAFQCPL